MKQVSTFKAILIGSRPPTLLLGISPVILGSALGLRISSQELQWWPLVGSLLAVVLMQSAANLVNDVKDAETGVDNEERIGPLRVVQAGLLSKKAATYAYLAMLGLSLLIGALLAVQGGLELIALAIASCIVAYLYTGGPKPLSHIGLGEVAALLFFGPVAVFGTAFLQSGIWPFQAWYVAVGPGLLAASVMAINNLRDRGSDREVGKHTLAVLTPDWFGNQLPWNLWLGSIVCYAMAVSSTKNFYLGTSLILLMLITGLFFLKPIYNWRLGRLNEALKKTSLFTVFYCLAYTATILL